MKNIFILTFFLLQLNLPVMSQSRDTLIQEFHEILIEDRFFNVYRSDSVICKLLLVNNDSLYLFRAINSEEIVSRVYDKNDKYDLIISDTSFTQGYLGDTLFDANFDGYVDYVINYYSPTNYYPRDEKRIFLLNESNSKLISPIVLFNSYFDKNNKFILSMSYYHPDTHKNIMLSKYKWKQHELVEVENVVKQDEKTLILYDLLADKKREIESLPEEYKKLEQIEWFWKK